ncbi:MAG: N-acetylneuraminate synthase, partial [Bacteroidia bacterium]
MRAKKVYIIAEAGVNHNGSIDMAYQLIDKAKEIGADCVKFQT